MVSFSTSPYPKILLDFCENGKWEKAIKLCRFVKEKSLWAVLASISLYKFIIKKILQRIKYC